MRRQDAGVRYMSDADISMLQVTLWTEHFHLESLLPSGMWRRVPEHTAPLSILHMRRGEKLKSDA